jgi:organic hydroperoxide reductase OsmC/OhrA
MGALASCFVSTFVAIAEYSKFRFHDVRVKVNGKLEKVEGGFRFTEVQVSPTLWVIDPLDEETGMKLLEKAKRACLISRSMNSQFTLEATVLAGVDGLPAQAASCCPS